MTVHARILQAIRTCCSVLSAALLLLPLIMQPASARNDMATTGNPGGGIAPHGNIVQQQAGQVVTPLSGLPSLINNYFGPTDDHNANPLTTIGLIVMNNTHDFSINAHGICRVLNIGTVPASARSDNKGLMIPLYTKNEWVGSMVDGHPFGFLINHAGRAGYELLDFCRQPYTLGNVDYTQAGGISDVANLSTVPVVPAAQPTTVDEGAVQFKRVDVNHDATAYLASLTEAKTRHFNMNRDDCLGTITYPDGTTHNPCFSWSWVEHITATFTKDIGLTQPQAQAGVADGTQNGDGTWSKQLTQTCDTPTVTADIQERATPPVTSCPPPVVKPVLRACSALMHNTRHWVTISTNNTLALHDCGSGYIEDPLREKHWDEQQEYWCFDGTDYPTENKQKINETVTGTCLPIVNGACAATLNACAAGTPVSGRWQPGMEGYVHLWDCQGAHTGTTAYGCSYTEATCAAPLNTCTAGTAANGRWQPGQEGKVHLWDCVGSPGTSTTCSFTEATCGTALNACDSGTVGGVSQNGADHSWTCTGSAANVATCGYTDGVCDNSQADHCTGGTAINGATSGDGGTHTWQCQGSAGNTSGTCSLCNAGFELFSGTCKAVCTGGTSRNGSGDCVCPAGQALVNGTCQHVFTGVWQQQPGVCNATCGGHTGTATATVVCNNGDCDPATKPAPVVATCTNNDPCPPVYDGYWYTVAGVCNATCGGGTGSATESVYCSNGNCDPATMPSPQTTTCTNNNACPASYDGWWRESDSCSASCGQNGTWLSQIYCEGPQYWDPATGMIHQPTCDPATKPAGISGQPCEADACPPTCPGDQIWDGSSCVSQPPSCTGGQSWNGSACVCPGGQTWNGNSCQTNQSNPPVNGACGGADNTCASGDAYGWNSSTGTWGCVGSNGGSTVSCGGGCTQSDDGGVEVGCPSGQTGSHIVRHYNNYGNACGATASADVNNSCTTTQSCTQTTGCNTGGCPDGYSGSITYCYANSYQNQCGNDGVLISTTPNCTANPPPQPTCDHGTRPDGTCMTLTCGDDTGDEDGEVSPPGCVSAGNCHGYCENFDVQQRACGSSHASCSAAITMDQPGQCKWSYHYCDYM